MTSRRLPEGGTWVDRSKPIGFRFDGAGYEGFGGHARERAPGQRGRRRFPEPDPGSASRDLLGGDRGAERPRRGPRTVGGPHRPGHRRPLGRRPGRRAQRRRGRPRRRRAPTQARHRHRHVETLVVGGGPAGRTATKAAGNGDRVLLVDERHVLDDPPTGPDVTAMPNATALGVYDDGYVVVHERVRTTETIWHIRAANVVLATGVLERPIAFAGNDLPGVMLAGAAVAYVERFGVAPGDRAVVFATNEWGLAAEILHGAGVEVARTVDARNGGGHRGSRGRRRRGGRRSERRRNDRGRRCRPPRDLGWVEPRPHAVAVDRRRSPLPRHVGVLRSGRRSLVALGDRRGRRRPPRERLRAVRRGRRRRVEVRRPPARPDGGRHRRDPRAGSGRSST